MCKRCSDQKLDCEYQKHRRGRRKKITESHTSRSPSQSRSRSPEQQRRPGVRLSTLSSNEHRSHAIRFSHVVPIEGDSTRECGRYNEHDLELTGQHISPQRQLSLHPPRGLVLLYFVQTALTQS